MRVMPWAASIFGWSQVGEESSVRPANPPPLPNPLRLLATLPYLTTADNKSRRELAISTLDSFIDRASPCHDMPQANGTVNLTRAASAQSLHLQL